MTGFHYSDEEIELLKKWYPKEGLPGTMVQLQKRGYRRTANSLRIKVSKLKLKSPYCSSNFPLGSRPHKDDIKIQTYLHIQDLLKKGYRVSDACKKTGMTRAVYYRIRLYMNGVIV